MRSRGLCSDRIIRMGTELLEGKGGGSRLGGWLPMKCVFTNTLEAEEIVWSETSEAVSDASDRGRYF